MHFDFKFCASAAVTVLCTSQLERSSKSHKRYMCRIQKSAAGKLITKFQWNYYKMLVIPLGISIKPLGPGKTLKIYLS